MKSSINTSHVASNVILMFSSKVTPAGTSEVTRVNYLWTAMLDLNAAPRGTEEQDAIDFGISIDMVSEMRGILETARENDFELFDDYYAFRDLVYECLCEPDLTSEELAVLEARFAAADTILLAKDAAVKEARAQLKAFEEMLAEIVRLEALPLRAS